METYSILFILALLLSLIIQLWLSNRQTKAIISKRNTVPEAFAEHISIEQHQKAADYSTAKLAINKIKSPLFDSRLFTKNLENIYVKIWNDYLH